jgi:hypothetical protein
MTGLVHVTPVGTDHYNVLTMPQCYIGSGAFRSQTGGQAVVWLSRLHGIASSGTDTMIVTGDGSFIFDAFVGGYVLATECQLDQQCSSGGGFYMLNCSRGPDTGASRIDHLATAAESIAVFGGYARLSLDLVGGVFIDQDHYRLGGHNVTVESGTRTFFGNFGRFLETAAAENVFLIFGSIVQGAEFDAQGVSYGTTKGSEFADFADGGTIFAFDPAATDYAYDGGGAETFVFDFGQNAFGINPATGLPVGPTTPTLTHLDAALGVGTGFGSRAVEPASGCRFLVNGT